MQHFVADNAEIASDLWDNFIQKCSGASICARYGWWSIVAPNWKALIITDDSGEWVAVLPFCRHKKFYFINTLSPPFWTPYTGPYILKNSLIDYPKSQYLHKIWSYLIAVLPKFSFIQLSLPIGVAWNNELKTAGFKIIPKLSYVADFQNITCFPAMQSQLAHKLRQAERQYFVLKEVGLDELDCLLSFPQNQKKYSVEKIAVLKKLITSFSGQPLIGLFSENQELAVINWAPSYASVWLNVLTVSNPNLQTSRATAGFLLKHQLDRAFTQQEIFDFEGSEIPGVEMFYRRFGFEPYNYFVATKHPFSSLLPTWV